MASNKDDYYNSYGNQPQPHVDSSPSPVSQFDPRYAPSSRATPAPSYHTTYPPPAPSVAPYPTGGDQHQDLPYPTGQRDPPSRTGPSPFDTVFDDHVYPADSHNPRAAASVSDMSQQGYYGNQDTAYYGQQQNYGQGAYGQSRPAGSNDDIPLQDRAGKDGPDPETGNDHIYDDPNAPVAGGRRRKKRSKVALGQLGMFGSDKKRIPWVVYIFSVAQIAVFIGEIVNNGKPKLLASIDANFRQF